MGAHDPFRRELFHQSGRVLIESISECTWHTWICLKGGQTEFALLITFNVPIEARRLGNK